MKTINYRGKELVYSNQEGFFKIVEQGLWETETFDVLDKLVVSGQVFIDIGAWCGILSVYAAKLGAIVHTIEPDKISYDELVRNMQVNRLNTIWYSYHSAVSDKNGVAELNSMNNAFGNSMSSLISERVNNGVIDSVAIREVQTITIDSLLSNIKEKICLIKIDTEGGEYLILNQETLVSLSKHEYPPLYISFHPGWIPDMKILLQNFNPFFEFYNIESDKRKIYTKEQFETAMLGSIDNTFLLIKK